MRSRGTIENLVIGGGPAGAMVAMRLAAAGRMPTLLEKERSAHHKVCGEFLSPEAVKYLNQAGVDPFDLGAVPITRVHLSSGPRTVETELPFRALSLSRYMLDEVMLARAQEEGCDVQRGVHVDALERDGDGWLVKTRTGPSIRARAVFLASGKHELHGWNRGRGRQSDLIGFKMHWQLAAPQTRALREVMELFLFPGGYGGLSLVEREVANLCLVVRRSMLRSLGGWTELLATIRRTNRQLDRRLECARAMWERPLAISPIPYGHLTERSGDLWRVGDQAAVIPSFTGDGMSIALHSANLAAQMYLDGKCTEEFNRLLRQQLRRGMNVATMLSEAMVTPVGRMLATFALQAVPGAMRRIALSTRIPEEALITAIDDTPGQETLPAALGLRLHS
jgi:flavin-dependent dehydrogenase